MKQFAKVDSSAIPVSKPTFSSPGNVPALRQYACPGGLKKLPCG